MGIVSLDDAVKYGVGAEWIDQALNQKITLGTHKEDYNYTVEPTWPGAPYTETKTKTIDTYADKLSVGGLVLDSTKWQKDTPQSKWQDANYRLVENDFGRYNLVAKKNQDKVLADVNFHRQLEKLTEAGWENFGLMNIDRIPDNVVKSGLKSRNSGGKGHDVIDGGADNDHLRGNAGDDKLIGGQGDDALHGGPGNDILDGGSGTNYMFGKALWRTKVSIKLQKRVVLKRKG